MIHSMEAVGHSTDPGTGIPGDGVQASRWDGVPSPGDILLGTMTAGTGMTGLGIPGIGIPGIGIPLGTTEAIIADITHIMDIAVGGTETTGADTVAGMPTMTGHHTSAHAVPLQWKEETVWVQGLLPIAEPVHSTTQKPQEQVHTQELIPVLLQVLFPGQHPREIICRDPQLLVRGQVPQWYQDLLSQATTGHLTHTGPQVLIPQQGLHLRLMLPDPQAGITAAV